MSSDVDPRYTVVGRVLVSRELLASDMREVHGHVSITHEQGTDVVDVVISRCATCDAAHETDKQ